MTLDTGIVAYDLVAPTSNPLTAERRCYCGQQLEPLIRAMTPFRRPVKGAPPRNPHAECYRRHREQVKAATIAKAEEDMAEWQKAYELHDHPAVLAVLDLHKPEASYSHDRVECSHCEEGDALESTRPVAWPCPTYAAVRDNL